MLGVAFLVAQRRPHESPSPEISGGSRLYTFWQVQAWGWPARTMVGEWKGYGSAPWALAPNKQNDIRWKLDRWATRPVAGLVNVALFATACALVHLAQYLGQRGVSTRRLLLLTALSAILMALIRCVPAVEIDQQTWRYERFTHRDPGEE